MVVQTEPPVLDETPEVEETLNLVDPMQTFTHKEILDVVLVGAPPILDDEEDIVTGG